MSRIDGKVSEAMTVFLYQEPLTGTQLTTIQSSIGVIPSISGTPAYGETLTSNVTGQWYANGVAISGETGNTLIVPASLSVGAIITQNNSNGLTLIDSLDNITWALRLQTSRGSENSTPVVALSSAITSWADQYGTSGKIATSSSSPTLQIGNNGQRVVRLNGSQKFTVPTITINGDLTITLVFQPSSVAAASRNIVIGAAGATYIQLQSSTGIRIKPSGTSSFVDLTLPRSLNIGRWYVISIVVSGNTVTVYENGQAGSSGTLAATLWQIQDLCDGIAGDVGAFLISNTALNSSQRISLINALTQYQTKKFYISSSVGSDNNTGFTNASPFATISKAISIGLFPGDVVYLRSGDVWREDVRPVSPWTYGVGNDKILFTTTGTGRATILGSFQVSTPWTNVTGNEYSTPLSAFPRNAFWINGSTIDETTVTKLVSAFPGSLSAGQYGYGSGTLRVNIGMDPTGQRIEVPRDGNSSDSHIINIIGYHCYRFENLNLYFAYVDGFFASGKETQLVNSNCSWNGEDGCGSGTSGQVDILNCRCVANGGERTALGGRGDGISFHDFATGTISGNVVIDNRKGGITNLSGCTVTVCRNYIYGNNLNLYILSVPGQSGVHTIHSNIIITRTDDQKIGINRDGNGNPAIIRAYNNTIYNPFSSGVGINQADEARGNIVRGFPTGIVGLSASGAFADHNCVFGATSAPYSGIIPGAGSITTDPLFIDIANFDFRILRGSGCYATGPSLNLPNYNGIITNNIGAL